MSDDALEQAYQRGDHRTARRLAREIVRAGAGSALARTTARLDDPERVARARRILDHTAPDRFLAWVGALGLGLVVWLVYNYAL